MNDITHAIIATLEKLKQEIPDAIENFAALSASALKSNVLDRRTKELITLTISSTKTDVTKGYG